MIIVIPTADPENLIKCYNSIKKNELLENHTVIIINDGNFLAASKDHNSIIVVGEKPFIFSRNVNVGMKKSLEKKENLVIMCDDVTLETMNGLSVLEKESDGYAVVSPSVDGDVGNDNQRNKGRIGIVDEPKELCFMCVLIKHETIKQIGLMDERFIGYGYEDIDYSRRVREAGLKLGVLDKVKVSHVGHSVFRNRPDFGEMAEINRKIYLEKWGSL